MIQFFLTISAFCNSFETFCFCDWLNCLTPNKEPFWLIQKFYFVGVFFTRKTVFFMYRQFLEIILTQFNSFYRFLSIFTNFLLFLYILDHGRYFLFHIFFPTMDNIHCWTFFIQSLNFNVFNIFDLLFFLQIC